MGALRDKAFELAVKGGKLSQQLKRLHEFDYASQLARSSSSVGANIEEAFRAISDRECAMKLQISLKECGETKYWLSLTSELGLCETYEENGLATEVEKMLTSSIKTVKARIEEEEGKNK